MTELLQGIDPKTGRPVGEPLAPTTTEELDRILAAAAAAAPTLVALPATTRQTALNLAADRLDAAVEELVPLVDA